MRHSLICSPPCHRSQVFSSVSPSVNRLNIEPQTLPSAAEVPVISLTQLVRGSCGTVVDVLAEEDDAARLKRLGVCAGRVVQLVQKGDPMIIRVLGCRLGLSARLAEIVQVRPVADAPAAPCKTPALESDPLPSPGQIVPGQLARA